MLSEVIGLSLASSMIQRKGGSEMVSFQCTFGMNFSPLEFSNSCSRPKKGIVAEPYKSDLGVSSCE